MQTTATQSMLDRLQMPTKDHEYTLGDRTANEELWKKTPEEPVLEEVKKRKCNWLR